MRRALKVVGLVLLVLAAFAVGWAWPILVRPPLVVGQDAVTDAASAAVVPAVEEAGGRVIVARPPAGTPERDVLVIVYPGGLVRPQAYEWLARVLAAQGYLTVIPEFSFDLAVTDVDRADTLIARYGEGKKVVLAGHSLGGAMAAQYASDREEAGSGLAGLVLMGAYPGGSADLSGAALPVLSLVGEHDEVVDAGALDDAWARLPGDTERVVVSGSVHAFFGRYGAQSGDGIPRVPRVTAETQVSQAVEGFLAKL
ncbi:MAG: alpha/beta hydrolase [Propionicimonas sp.]|nr:alpha/beta hydrolase [Propionicimonas sp.]